MDRQCAELKDFFTSSVMAKIYFFIPPFQLISSMTTIDVSMMVDRAFQHHIVVRIERLVLRLLILVYCKGLYPRFWLLFLGGIYGVRTMVPLADCLLWGLTQAFVFSNGWEKFAHGNTSEYIEENVWSLMDYILYCVIWYSIWAWRFVITYIWTCFLRDVRFFFW